VTTRPTNSWIPFTNCSIQIANLPIAAFELPEQRRKKHHSAEKRHILLTRYGAYADADGTNCYPGDKKIIERTGWSRSTIERLRGDLEMLGFMLADGYVRHAGSRTATKKWRLVLPPAAQRALGLLDDVAPSQYPIEASA